MRRRRQKAKGKEEIQLQRVSPKLSSDAAEKITPKQTIKGLTMTKQESSGKEKGFHKLPYTN